MNIQETDNFVFNSIKDLAKEDRPTLKELEEDKIRQEIMQDVLNA